MRVLWTWKLNKKKRIRIMTERHLTHDEIINKMDFGNGYICVCGEPLDIDKNNTGQCTECGREYRLCIGIVGGWVREKGE